MAEHIFVGICPTCQTLQEVARDTGQRGDLIKILGGWAYEGLTVQRMSLAEFHANPMPKHDISQCEYIRQNTPPKDAPKQRTLFKAI